GPPSEPAPAEERPHRRRAAVLLALVCVLVAVTTTLVVLSQEDGRQTAGNAVSTTSATPRQAESPAPSPTEPTSTASKTKATKNAPPAKKPRRASLPAKPAAAVSGYYALMPGNQAEGWRRLTAKFQQSPAGGLAGYRRFWNSVSSVRAAGISARGAVVQATVNYSFKDGRKIREQHRYVLVNRDGRWLIDTVNVLSSSNSP
ncbi:MAG: hypothetical protein ACRDSK_10900, partial [Actinophytocola sp.]